MQKIKTDQNGNITTIAVGVLAFLVIVLGSLSAWALIKYNEEKDTVSQQVAAAVEEARTQQRQEDERRFEEERKNPYRSYSAPEVFGGIAFEFPKNWNVHSVDTTRGSTQIDLTIHPEAVRETDNGVNIYAFRMQLIDELFDQQNRRYQRMAEKGELKAQPVTVSEIEGVQYDGEVVKDKDGRLIVLPYRDKTITIWTESRDYLDDFQEILRRAQISR